MKRAEMRAAALTLLDGYETANAGSLKQTYPARPMTIHPPSAFVDNIVEAEVSYTPAGLQRTPSGIVRIVRGTFGTADVAEANDALVDGFIEYVVDNRHVVNGRTLILVTSVEDDDPWVPEWIPTPEGAEPRAYYSTLVTLSGEGLHGGVI